MYDIAICDDDHVDIMLLRELILRLSDKPEDLRIHEYSSGTELLKAAAVIHFPLVFLDIQMDEMDGEETARKLRLIDNNTILVFCTGKAEPSLETFLVQPYRYIKKNMPEERKERYISQSIKRMEEEKRQPVLKARSERVSVYLKAGDIVYIEKCKKTTRAYLSASAMERYGISSRAEIRISERLEDLYERLREYGFGYPHNSYIVNFKYMMICTNTELRLEGYEDMVFKVSRSKAQEFNRLKVIFSRGDWRGK